MHSVPKEGECSKDQFDWVFTILNTTKTSLYKKCLVPISKKIMDFTQNLSGLVC